MQENLDEQTKSQLAVLSEVSAIFGKHNMEFWLRGGWAIDFLLGEITRSHRDIDMVTWITNREQIEGELLKSGYQQIPVKEPFRNRQSDFRKHNVDITLCYVTYDEDEGLVLNGLPEWVWQEESLMQHNFRLHSISVKVLHPKQLLAEKEIYKQIGRPYRAKDGESIKILKRIIADFK